MKDFLIIITGGTIDAMPYTATPVHIVPLMLSIVPRTVKQLGLDEHCHYLHWSMKDSKQFDDYELRTLAKVIAWSEANYVVITHGTDRMPENSRRLSELLEGTKKTVVFTGSMEPLTHGRERSDGFENLRVSLTESKVKPAGVHVVMHGLWFDPSGLRKNLETKSFYVVSVT